MNKRFSKLVAVAVCTAVLAAVMFGCAAKAEADLGYFAEESITANGMIQKTTRTAAATMVQTTMAMDAYYPKEDFKSESAVPQATQLSQTTGGEVVSEPTERKLIRNANYSMETLEYDNTIAKINDLINRLGGYIQSQNSSGEGAIKSNYYVSRNSNYTIRLPAEKFNDFYNEIANFGSITNSHTYVDDVSSYYYDTEARLRTMEIREERLLEILQKATKLEDIIMIEQELQGVRYEIENLQGTLNRVDDQVAYSTIYLNVSEVFEHTEVRVQPRTFGEKLKDRFENTIYIVKDGLEDFALFLLGDSIMIIIWVGIFVGIFFVIRYFIRRAVRKHRERKAAKSETNKEAE